MKAARINIQTLNVHVSLLSDLLPGKSISVVGSLEEFAPGATAVATKAWQHFQKRADGATVVDYKTGLMWAANETPERLNFSDAEAYAKSLELGGFNDWRLPDVEELESIRDLTRHAPCVDTDYFKSNSSYVWSRTPCAWSSGSAWIVLFSSGYVDYGTRNYTAFVRPVRAVSAGQ